MSLSDAVERLIAEFAPQPHIDELAACAVARVEHFGTREYGTEDGERWENATLAEEVRNFLEEMEDGLAYAASAYDKSGDRGWLLIVPLIAMAHSIARYTHTEEGK